MKGVRVPGDIRISTRFFGRFTVPDLIRIGIPLGLALLTISTTPFQLVPTLFWLTVGLGTGWIWYGFRPYSRAIDIHVYHLLRWIVGVQRTKGRDVFTESDPEEDDTVGVHDGRIITENGVAIGVIRVDPTNLEMKTEAEQRALHRIYRELFDTVTYPIHIHSRQHQLDLTSYIQRIVDRDSSLKQLKEDYIGYCNSLSNQEIVSTHHYIVLRVESSNNGLLGRFSNSDEIEARSRELDRRLQDVEDAVDTADLTAEQITGRELEQFAEEVDISKPNTGVAWTQRPDSDDHGEYRKTVYISELPASVELAWPLQLLRSDGLVDVTQVIEPENPSSTSKTLNRLSEKLNAEIDSFIRQGYRGTNKLEGLLDDVEWMQNLLADRVDQPVEYGAYVTVHASDKDRCQQTYKQVCNRMQTMQIQYRVPVLRTDHAYLTDSPLHRDGLDEKQLMPGRSAAAGFPFATQPVQQDNGVIFGVDTRDETPVLLDRFSWSSHSMARMGMVGSGKSYAAKVEVLRAFLAYPRLQIIVVDPKKEYTHLVRSLDGTVHTLEPDGDYSFDEQVVGFEVEERGQLDDVNLLVELVQQIYAATSQNRRKTLVLIDEARILMNDERGRNVLNQFVLEGRDTNTAITLISQNASHFTSWREGREILDNMPGTVLMRHDRVPDDVTDYFQLSQREEQELYELKTGTESPYSEAVLKVSGRLDTRIRIESTPQEHATIETRSEEVMVE